MKKILMTLVFLFGFSLSAFGATVNINTATVQDLMSLNGIGEAKAKAIVEYRAKNRFKKIEDIMNVKGIGKSIFEKIKNDITVSPTKSVNTNKK